MSWCDGCECSCSEGCLHGAGTGPTCEGRKRGTGDGASQAGLRKEEPPDQLGRARSWRLGCLGAFGGRLGQPPVQLLCRPPLRRRGHHSPSARGYPGWAGRCPRSRGRLPGEPASAADRPLQELRGGLFIDPPVRPAPPGAHSLSHPVVLVHALAWPWTHGHACSLLGPRP